MRRITDACRSTPTLYGTKVTPEKLDVALLFRDANELAAAGKHSEAVRIFKRLVASAIDARFHIGYAVSLQQLGHWDESIVQFHAGLDLKPHYCEGDARLMLAESLMKTGQKRQAIEQWRIVAAMEPEYPSYEAVPNAAKASLAKHAV